jgi:hypothetical protein
MGKGIRKLHMTLKHLLRNTGQELLKEFRRKTVEVGKKLCA